MFALSRCRKMWFYQSHSFNRKVKSLESIAVTPQYSVPPDGLAVSFIRWGPATNQGQIIESLQGLIHCAGLQSVVLLTLQRVSLSFHCSYFFPSPPIPVAFQIIASLLFKLSFLHLFCVSVQACADQRTICRTWFPASARWLLTSGLVESSLAYQSCQCAPVSVLCELCWVRVLGFNMLV